MATRWPPRRARSDTSPASAIAPAGSAVLCVVRCSVRMASATASSGTVMTRARPSTMIATASGSGSRHATPSAKVAASSVGTTWPARTESAVAGASSETTPTISVASPSRSRTVTRLVMPEPMPTGA